MRLQAAQVPAGASRKEVGDAVDSVEGPVRARVRRETEERDHAVHVNEEDGFVHGLQRDRLGWFTYSVLFPPER